MTEINLNQPQSPQLVQTKVPQTVADLDKLIDQTQQRVKVSVWGYVVLSLVFPPFTTIWAFYKANKKQVLHLVLPAMTIAFSVMIVFSAISSRSTVSVPVQLTKLGIGPQTGVSQTKLILFDNITLFLGLVGLVAGVYWKLKAKKEGVLGGFAIWFMIAIIMLQMVAVGYLFYYVYQSAYSTIVPIINSNYQGIQ